MAIDAAADAIVAASELAGMSDVKNSLIYSGAAGAVMGAMNKDPRQAAMWSAAVGGVMPYLGKEKVTTGNLALSIVTSTAVGMISNALVNRSKKVEIEKIEKEHGTCSCQHK